VGLYQSTWRFARLAITCLLSAATSCSQTPAPNSAQASQAPRGKGTTVAESGIRCPSAGSHDSPSLKGRHKVTLTWTASPGKSVVGYCLYRSRKKDVAKNKPNTPFRCAGCEQINIFPIKSTACVDDVVPDKSTYFYVATAIDGQETLSPASNEARADIGDGSARPSPQRSTYTLCRDPSSPK
jgi:hypothetical protein